tara:strand:- start:2303 stop:2908 length:606 start_codon:yes stop_codon:yes gene_type:complete
MIDAIKDGPLKVVGVDNFKNSKNEKIDGKEEMYLCRCGSSKNKPYCDGSHKAQGFKDEKESTDGGKVDDYEGKDITIHDKRSVCSHKANCTNNLKSVFKYGKEPWIDADGSSEEEVIKLIKTCPSGALSYSKNGEKVDKFDNEEGIVICKDGPYEVSGVEFNSDDKPESSDHYTLCRCGSSKNKPYCDGQHWHAKFKDDKN